MGIGCSLWSRADVLIRKIWFLRAQIRQDRQWRGNALNSHLDIFPSFERSAFHNWLQRAENGTGYSLGCYVLTRYTWMNHPCSQSCHRVLCLLGCYLTRQRRLTLIARGDKTAASGLLYSCTASIIAH